MNCCEGCKKAAPGTNLECSVYGIVPSMYARMGACPVNPPVTVTAKAKVRAGQQKGKRGKKGR